MKLKGKQKRYLRSQAHGMRPLFQVGKEGLTAAAMVFSSSVACCCCQRCEYFRLFSL